MGLPAFHPKPFQQALQNENDLSCIFEDSPESKAREDTSKGQNEKQVQKSLQLPKAAQSSPCDESEVSGAEENICSPSTIGGSDRSSDETTSQQQNNPLNIGDTPYLFFAERAKSRNKGHEDHDDEAG